MYRRLQLLSAVSRRAIPCTHCTEDFVANNINQIVTAYSYHHPIVPSLNFSSRSDQSVVDGTVSFHPISADSDDSVLSVPDHDLSAAAKDAATIQKLLKLHTLSSVEELERSLDGCGLSMTEDLVLQVLRRHRSEWKPALLFFNWVSRGEPRVGRCMPGTGAYNGMLDILGRMKRFEQLQQVLDEMSKRDGLINERTYAILVHRYAGAHKVQEAIDILYRRKEFGLGFDLIAFQTLLMSLCRYKHVEAAEFLFHSKRKDFPLDIKTLNIILNGWCVLGRLREAKRFWNDIISSRCKPDKFTYGIFINSLTKAGKISTAVKLFHSMWEKGCSPDVAICNCIIDGLCFKKRIPEALEIFGEMNEKGCLRDVVTYNTLIKHLCKIRRMEKVYELLDEMEQEKGNCIPNARTFNYLLNSLKEPKEIPCLLERMERNGCKITGDTHNLILRLYVGWNQQEATKNTWLEMERDGVGPDQRSYTIMIHGLHSQGRMKEALHYFTEMTSKSMIPEPRTKLLVKAINIKLQEQESGQRVGMINDDNSLSHPVKSNKKRTK
ncbi:putative pentatricopeptide repeat-containing protein At3g15200 [Telopea speciosissima]|uniref:putative pentatricopeptide repeat-containing protein At3g15200 n=1 Tax=Telopea speciosissima TaxID=54955 RepID=UPI001CC52D86|nr:putative pentatricopeptide repeat-containing protein At3g15200 [Telopea speciosissima]